MKKLFLIPLIILFLEINSAVQAQTNQTKIDQVAFIQLFAGSWQCDLGKDTTEVWLIKPFGKGMEAHFMYKAQGKVYFEGKQFWGFDTRYENIVCYTMYQGGLFQRFTGSFTSPKHMYWESRSVSNPQEILLRLDFEFKSTDSFIVTEGKTPALFSRIKE